MGKGAPYRLQDLLTGLEGSLRRERAALQEGDLEKLTQLEGEIEDLFRLLQEELPPAQELIEELPPGEEVRELFKKVKSLREENLQLAEGLKHRLREELGRLNRGARTLQAYSPAGGDRTYFLKKKV